MHIVQLLPELNQGGVERGVVEINREFVKRGHQSTVISAGGSQVPTLGKDGGKHIQLDVCSKNPLTFPLRVQQLKTVLNQLKPDILHARSRVPAWLAWYANKKLKIPFVTTVHGFNSVGKYSEIMTKGDRVIYISSAIKAYILKNYSVDESKLRYVPRGIDMDYFDPKKVDYSFIETFKEKYDLQGKTILTTVGRITELKGIDDFIRAIAIVQKKHPQVVGLVVGGARHNKEAFFQSLKNLAIQLDAHIHFVDSQTQLREIYTLSNLVISATSIKPETFGRTIAESLAMETPVVASAHGGALDIIRDGVNGFFFEPQNSLDLSHKISKALSIDFSRSRPHIEQNFSLEKMTDTELTIYAELLNEKVI